MLLIVFYDREERAKGIPLRRVPVFTTISVARVPVIPFLSCSPAELRVRLAGKWL